MHFNSCASSRMSRMSRRASQKQPMNRRLFILIQNKLKNTHSSQHARTTAKEAIHNLFHCIAALTTATAASAT
eukprot:scaffold62894_cov32-Attheya_sp.AAC.2